MKSFFKNWRIFYRRKSLRNQLQNHLLRRKVWWKKVKASCQDFLTEMKQILANWRKGKRMVAEFVNVIMMSMKQCYLLNRVMNFHLNFLFENILKFLEYYQNYLKFFERSFYKIFFFFHGLAFKLDWSIIASHAWRLITVRNIALLSYRDIAKTEVNTTKNSSTHSRRSLHTNNWQQDSSSQKQECGILLLIVTTFATGTLFCKSY